MRTMTIISLALALTFTVHAADTIKVTDYTGERKSEKRGEPLSIEKMPLNDFLAVMATQAGLTYVSNPNINGTVDGVFYQSDPVDMAREAARAHGVSVSVRENCLEVSSPKIEENAPRKTFIYKLKYLRMPNMKTEAQAKEIEGYFTEILGLESAKGDSVKISTKSNTLVIHTTESKLERLDAILKSVDTKRPLINTTVDIYEVNNSPRKLMGMDWASLNNQGITLTFVNSIASALTGGFMPFNGTSPSYGMVFQPDQVRVILRAMETKGLSRNLTRMIASSEQAEKTRLSFARSEPIPQLNLNQTTGAYDAAGFEYKDIGDILELSAQLLDDNTVRVQLKPEVSTSNQNKVFTSGSGTGNGLRAEIPIIRKREADLTVYCKINKSLIIGGLRENAETDASSRIPLFGWLMPYLFSTTDRARADVCVAIVVTPMLVTDEMVTETTEADSMREEISHKGEGRGRWFVGRGGWYDDVDGKARKEEGTRNQKRDHAVPESEPQATEVSPEK